MRKAIDHTGKRYGLLVVLSRTDDQRRAYWMCRCDCGNVRSFRISRVLAKLTISCGCARSQIATARMTRHGHTKGNTQTYLHKAWTAMRSRCGNPNASGYEHYGARGISVCDRWQVFENFVKDMGERPTPHHSLDRIDVNGNYEPGNCRWATDVEQNRNKTNNRLLTVGNETKTMSAWAEETGLTQSVLTRRIEKSRLSPEEAISKPLRGRPLIEFNGERKSLSAWSRITGLHPETISARINKYGWSIERALTTPVQTSGGNQL